MTATDQKSREALYRRLMEEIKERMDILKQFCVEDPRPKHGLPHARAQEFCYLELRFVCELIALASLVAHGDIAATKHPKLRKEYKPGVILDEMLRLNPDFYPRACDQRLDEKGRLAGWSIARDPLTQKHLNELWIESGRFLHRGNINDIESEKRPDFYRLTQWHNKIRRLLNIHIVCLVDRKTAFCVVLNEEQTGGVVMVQMDRWISPDGMEWYSVH